MRGVQKVRRLTQYTYVYVIIILSLFNTVSCSWNALVPVFLESSESVVEELFILLFQSAICRTDNVSLLKNVHSHGGSGPHLIHGSLSPRPPESTSQTASRSVLSFLQGSWLWQTDWPTDRQTTQINSLSHATPSVTTSRIYAYSSEMRPNSRPKLCNLVAIQMTRWY